MRDGLPNVEPWEAEDHVDRSREEMSRAIDAGEPMSKVAQGNSIFTDASNLVVQIGSRKRLV